MTFGEYYYEPNAAIFTASDRNPSAACPEIANMKRCIVASEPPDTEGQTFKVSKLKNWRGNDKITARNMYADPLTFRPQFGIILMMNDKPSLDKVDRAIARTLSIVERQASAERWRARCALAATPAPLARLSV